MLQPAMIEQFSTNKKEETTVPFHTFEMFWTFKLLQILMNINFSFI